MKHIKSIALTITAVAGFVLPATSQAQGQGFNFYDIIGSLRNNSYQQRGSDQVGHGRRGGEYGYRDLRDNVLNIDRNGDQMTYRFGREMHAGCPISRKIYAQMQAHNGLTDQLLVAMRGTCPKTFKQASSNVYDSVCRIESIRNGAQVSDQVCSLIRQSRDGSKWVNSNSALFRPAAVRPVYDPVYNRIGTSVNLLPDWSGQIHETFARENACGCPNTKALHAHMKRYDQRTIALHKAYRGTCPATFKSAAFAARESLTSVQKLSKRVDVSERVCRLIDNSCPKLTYIKTNSDHFQPYVASSHATCSTGHRNTGSYRASY